jgi:hypothetical protein
MTHTLSDINQIIMPIGNDFNIKEKIDNLFENLIVHDNQIFNPYIFNHISWKEYKDNNFQQKTLDIITKHLVSYLRKKLQFFRENNRKNKFTLEVIIDFFEEFYKLLSRVNNTIIHFSLNRNDTMCKIKKWGSSYVIDTAITNLCNMVLSDPIISCAIQKSISSNLDNERNNTLYQYMKRIEIFFLYQNNSTTFLSNLVSTIDGGLINCIPTNKLDCIPQNISDVYQFKSYYQYLLCNNNKYYYINKGDINTRFPQLFACVCKQLAYIISTYDILFLQYFIKEYRNEIFNLSKYFDVFFLIFSKNIQTLEQMINYYGALHDDTTTRNDFGIIVQTAVRQKISLIESNDSINELVDRISLDINNNRVCGFLYLIGAELKNKDLFLSLLCNKLMYRSVYNKMVYNKMIQSIEDAHFALLQKYFTVGSTNQYNIILNDYKESMSFQLDDKTRLIITSLDYWTINHKMGHFRKPSEKKELNDMIFSQSIYEIFEQYNFKNKKRELVLYPHMGSVEITVDNINRSNIILTPAQMFCLELFEDMHMVYCSRILFNKLKKQLKYTDQFITNIIKSLIEGKVLIEVEPNILALNNEMPPSINLIKIFNNINCTATEIMKNTMIELAHSRNDVIMTNIMSILKKQLEPINSMNSDILYVECKKQIILFDTTKELFDIAIKTMCDKKYISVDENIVSKLVV